MATEHLASPGVGLPATGKQFGLADPLGCADPAQDGAGTVGAEIVDFPTTPLVVGQTVQLRATGLVGAASAPTDVELHLKGAYAADDGSTTPVDFTAALLHDGTDARGQDVLRLSRFGPFRNPFSGTDRPGVFHGTATLSWRTADAALTHTGKSKTVDLAVGPSLIVDELQPLDAQCGAPALRALPGIAYRLTVRPVGLRATHFVYELSNVNGSDGATRFSHDYAGHPVGTDTLGQDEAILFNQIVQEDQFYVSAIRVVASDDAGNAVETVLPLSIHRPMEVAYGGHYELAEIYEPMVASGCTPGSINTQVEYSETHEETRQQSVSVTVSTDWAQERGVSRTQDWQRGISQGETTTASTGGSETSTSTESQGYDVIYTQSQANEVGYNSTDGESWDWNMSEGTSNTDYESRMNSAFGEGSWSGTVGVEGSGSIPGFAKVTGKASTTAGVTVGAGTADTQGGSRTENASRGYSAGGQVDTSHSFGSTTTESQSQSLSGDYALSQSRTSSYDDSDSRSESRTWSLGEGTSEDQLVTEGMSEAEAQTWVRSSSVATQQSISGVIPRGRFGVFYRQTSRWVRRAEVRAYDLCGVAQPLGELQFNEWTWAPELAIGPSCDAAPPPSSLPAAHCYIPPCGG